MIKKIRAEPTPYNDYADLDVKSQGAKSYDSKGPIHRKLSHRATGYGSNGFQNAGLSVLKPQST
jgi:hypothetical protein